jgi:uncharacterized membrane protein
VSERLANRWRGVALASMVALFALVATWRLSSGISVKTLLLVMLFTLPLLAPAYGIWRANRYTFRWATLCVLPYLLIGMTEVVANASARAWSGAMLAVALTWFVALIAYLRVTARP